MILNSSTTLILFTCEIQFISIYLQGQEKSSDPDQKPADLDLHCF